MRLFVAFLACFYLCSPALAEVTLSDELCTQSSAMDVSVSTLLKSGKAFDCSDNKYAVEGPRVWVKIPFLADTLPAGTVEVQGDNNGLTTMQVHALLDDGTLLSTSYSARDVAKHWRSKGSYGLPVPGTDKPELRQRIRTVYLAIDHPKVASSISLI